VLILQTGTELLDLPVAVVVVVITVWLVVLSQVVHVLWSKGEKRDEALHKLLTAHTQTATQVVEMREEVRGLTDFERQQHATLTQQITAILLELKDKQDRPKK